MEKIEIEPQIFEEKQFKKTLGKQEDNLKMTALFKGNYNLKDPIFLRFYDLNKKQSKDTFIYCQGQVNCEKYFEVENMNLLLLYGERKKYLEITPEINFKQLYKEYSSFKNPFFLDFGLEFEQKVFKNMTPTLTFLTDFKDDKIID